MKKSRMLRNIISLMLVLALCLVGCGEKTTSTPTPAPTNAATDTPAPTKSTEPDVTPTTEPTKAPETTVLNGATNGSKTDESVTDYNSKYLKVALNVYYNDGDHNYYKNEAGPSIYITEEGQYALTFDCTKDLSEDAKNAGVSSLTNLTAIYLLDMGIAENNQSPLKGCDIMYDSVIVDGTPLTVTLKSAKSAFKSSGAFDTNDPINGWEGSQVEEAVSNSDHVTNFTSVKDPKTITVIFTLSNFQWETAGESGESGETGSGYTNTAVFSNIDFTNMNAITLQKYLGNGINLGNTLEAYGRSNLGINAPVRSYETYWGQPYTTKEMIQGMKNCGFDTIRIPVSWTNMMAYESGDYTINTKLMDRVQEIVDYALEAEMFVILNDHWDGGWWAMFGSATPATVDKAWALYESMWKQIAERFKDYSDMLIFESANEELGNSLNDNSSWADSGALSKDGLYEMTNKINQKFVDIIRSSGGKNANRFLLIAGYNTDFELTCDSRYKMPTDTANGKLLLSVHYYTPWNYCGAEKDARWGLKKEYEQMNTLFAKLQKFTDAGYGVIIGEYGALPVYVKDTQTHFLKQNTLEFTTNLLDLCDVYGYCPVLWSTNDSYKKKTCKMIEDWMTDLFTSRCYAEEVKLGDAYITNAQNNIKTNLANALEMWPDVETYEPGTPVAWIMWNGGAGTYSVGDTFNPADNTEGIKATNAIITGAGSYSVSLDFAGGNNGVTFSALGIADGELLFPNMYILIDSITVDGKELTLTGVPYTCSDDGKCTRVNLYNQWVTQLPDAIRVLGNKKLATPTPVDPADVVGIKNITVNFRVVIK